MKKQRWEESEKRSEEKTRQRKARREENGQRKEEKKKENGQRGEKKDWEERRSRCAKSRQGAKHWVFPMICGPGGSKSRLAKAAGAEPSGKMRDEKLYAVVARSTFRSQNAKDTSCSEHFSKLRCGQKYTTLWREAHFEVKMCKTPQLPSTFRSWDVEKVHAVVARSTFRSQNVQSTGSEHFWKLRCWKSACRCDAKHISKSTGLNRFWMFKCCFAWQAQGIRYLTKSEQNVRVL